MVRGQQSSSSPDGKKIVFCRSGNDNGILIYDIATNRTTPFTSAGKDPAWAGKDGRWIAYAAGSGTAEAIWAAEVSDGKPFLLRVGSLPSWAADGKTLFFQAFDKQQLMATELTGSGQFSPPQSRSAVPYQYPAVSSDGKRVAFKIGGDLVIQQMDGEKVAKRFALPQGVGLLGGWSPDSREFGFGGWNAGDPMPCIILDVETGLARRVASRWLTMPAWSPDGTKITFDLRLRTGTEIWMLDAAAIKKLPTFKMDTATASPATERSGVVQGWGGRGAANRRATANTLTTTNDQIAQRIERTDSFLKQLDTNHDGKIDADEAKDLAGKSMLERIFSRLGKELRYPVAIADLKGDVEAYYRKRAASEAAQQPNPAPAHPDQTPAGTTSNDAIAERITRLDTFLKRLDSNGNGKIDAEEAKDPQAKLYMERLFSKLGREPHYPVTIADIKRDAEEYYRKRAASDSVEQLNLAPAAQPPAPVARGK